MKIFWKKHRISISIVAFILIVAPAFFWATAFLVKRIQSRADLIQQKITDNDLEKLKIEKIPKMEEANAEFERNKNAVGIILSADSKVDFIRYIEELAGATNNRIEIKILNDDQNKLLAKEGAKPSAKKTKEDEKKSIEEQLSYRQYITMQLSLWGDYQSFLNFVHRLENNKYYVNIISLDLQKSFLDEDGSPKNQKAGSNDVFFSPAPTSDTGSPKVEEAKPILKSLLNIIIYVE
jgi:hypothetical protein